MLSIARLRTLAALLATISGAALSASLWFLPTTPTLLATALCGALYLILALGLFGTSRFTLFLAVAVPLARAWLGLYPLPLEGWEQLRTVTDVAIALTCVPVLWSSIASFEKSPSADEAAVEVDLDADNADDANPTEDPVA